MEILCLGLFVINFIIGIADAAVAWHNAPRLVAAVTSDPEGGEAAVRNVRSLLPLIVALYTSLNCYAYHHRSILYLAGVTALLAADIGLQFFMIRKAERSEA